ncbi:MAG: sigma-70 family RNA polymerase sigma factor [Ancalomicrobiaceae bacterium]|nr:sigma-70 family RNA polymerase sigma factor [Ancalomicrobiaceae bacterium]
MTTAAPIGLWLPVAGEAGRLAAAMRRWAGWIGRRAGRLGLRAWISLASRADAAGQPVARSDAATARTFEQLMLPHLDAAYTLARYLSGDADASDDIVQEAYLKAFSAYGDFRGGDARAWILAIVRNAARDWRERQARMRRRFVAPQPEEEEDDIAADALAAIADDIGSAEAGLLRREEDGLVRAIVDRLPDNLRDVLLMREIEDLSYRQIAETAGIPMGTVMSRLARARQAFARLWQRLAATDGGAA